MQNSIDFIIAHIYDTVEIMRKTPYNRIEVNPHIMLGKPVVKGTRIPVYLVLNLLAHGYTTKKVIKAYPELSLSDIEACLKFASRFLQLQEEGEMGRAYA